MISKSLFDNLPAYRRLFLKAKPFRHVVIENFFEEDKIERMLQDFPSADKAVAFVEMGRLIGKNVVEDVSGISPFYKELYAYIRSEPFLDAVSQITGIPGLLPDETMFGGGTHENINGSELTPHIDFNYDPRGKLHRRLNLLLYLNKEWDESWGGSIELHSDPHHPDNNEIKYIVPIFNRCVIFETSEYSWHGFPQIRLPENKQNLSRKSFSIFLYTKERPDEEIAAPHSTVYAPRPLPRHLKPGRTLSAEDVESIQHLVERRDTLIKYYQERELALSQAEQQKVEYINQLEQLVRLPLTGYALQEGSSKGFWVDGWVAKELEFHVRLEKEISRMTLYGLAPEFGPRQNLLTIQANGALKTFLITKGAQFTLEVLVKAKAGATLNISIHARESISPVSMGVNPDVRELAFLLHRIRFN